MSESSPHIVDVRPIDPGRIPMVACTAVERLSGGEALVLVCTCDPDWVGEAVARRADVAMEWVVVRQEHGVSHIRMERTQERV